MEEEYEEDVSPSKVNDAIYFFTRKPIDEDMEQKIKKYYRLKTYEENYLHDDSISEDIKHAILLRREKDKQTDFYRKLQTLNDRISVYKELFMTK